MIKTHTPGRTTIALALTLALASAAAAKTAFTYAQTENPGAIVAAVAFKSLVEGRPGGELTVNLVMHGAPNFQLFDAPDLFRDRREFHALMTDPEFVGYVRKHLLERSGDRIRFLGALQQARDAGNTVPILTRQEPDADFAQARMNALERIRADFA